ncbi:MAG TPA: cell division protein ZipA [Gammaproteobacteria bacterium]|nr:cell division protein ZipA [Gammaproteobacteria bacterium]
MWELRLILVLIGVVIVAGVYLLSRQNRKRDDAKPPAGSQRKSPVLGGSSGIRDELDDVSALEATAPRVELDAPSAGARSGSDEQLILALHVAARDGAAFEGAKVLESLGATGLKYGRYHIFHRLFKGDSGKSVFSVASMVEPGALEPEKMAEQVFPGLTLFLLLPGPQDGVDAYADMLATARNLAQQLGGEVLDETRSTLTRQTAHHIRERIIDFQRRVQLHARQ